MLYLEKSIASLLALLPHRASHLIFAAEFKVEPLDTVHKVANTPMNSASIFIALNSYSLPVLEDEERYDTASRRLYISPKSLMYAWSSRETA